MSFDWSRHTRLARAKTAFGPVFGGPELPIAADIIRAPCNFRSSVEASRHPIAGATARDTTSVAIASQTHPRTHDARPQPSEGGSHMRLADSHPPVVPRPGARRQQRAVREPALFRVGGAALQAGPHPDLHTAGRRADHRRAIHHTGLYAIQADAEEDGVGGWPAG